MRKPAWYLSACGLTVLCATSAVAAFKYRELPAMIVRSGSTTMIHEHRNCIGQTAPQFEGGRAAHGRLTTRSFTSMSCGRPLEAVGVYYAPDEGYRGADVAEWSARDSSMGNTTLKMSRPIAVE